MSDKELSVKKVERIYRLHWWEFWKPKIDSVGTQNKKEDK